MKIADKVTTILCDDLRMELGNKFSIMGVYGREMLFSSIPALLPRISLAVKLEGIKKIFTDFHVRLKTPDNESKNFTYPAPANLELDGETNLLIVISPFRVTSPGKAAIEITFSGDKKPSIIHEFEIKQDAA